MKILIQLIIIGFTGLASAHPSYTCSYDDGENNLFSFGLSINVEEENAILSKSAEESISCPIIKNDNFEIFCKYIHKAGSTILMDALLTLDATTLQGSWAWYDGEQLQSTATLSCE